LRRVCRAEDFSGRAEEKIGKRKEKISPAEDFPGKAEEKISRGREKIGKAEDFSGLFFLPPCLAEDFSDKAKVFSSNEFTGFGFRLKSPNPPHFRGAVFVGCEGSVGKRFSLLGESAACGRNRARSEGDGEGSRGRRG